MNEILLAIVKDTGLSNDIHNLTHKSAGVLLSNHHFDATEVYVSIAPEIILRRLDYPRGYERQIFSIKSLADGLDDCDHKMITMYWETGNGDCALGKSHSYKVCFKCGYHPTLLRSFKKWLKNL